MRSLRTPIARRRRSTVAGHPDQRHRVAGGNFGCCVTRAVVDHDNFDARESLRDDRIKAARQRVRRIASGDYHADLGVLRDGHLYFHFCDMHPSLLGESLGTRHQEYFPLMRPRRRARDLAIYALSGPTKKDAAMVEPNDSPYVKSLATPDGILRQAQKCPRG